MEFFSGHDCMSGFYQIDVNYKDRNKTAFSTPIGNFQIRRCPFGARNSGAKFHAEMDRIFRDGLYTKCVIFVDVILVFGKDKSTHDANLAWVLARCVEYNVKLKLEKCQSAQRPVQFLVFEVSGSYIRPLREKVDKLLQPIAPRNRTELKRIVGKLTFYARFIHNCSKLLAPFRDLMKQDRLSMVCVTPRRFIKLRDSIKNAPSLLLAARDSDNIVTIQVLENSFEATCESKDNQLIGCASRLMSTTESNYSDVEK